MHCKADLTGLLADVRKIAEIAQVVPVMLAQVSDVP